MIAASNPEGALKLVQVKPPLSNRDVEALNVGDKVLINGIIYTARDAAHKRFMELLDQGKPLPFDLKGQIIYYVGPSPPRPGRVIGAAGPTTTGRMDLYTPRLLALGLRGTIGKGNRRQNVIDAMKEHKAVYFIAVGGAGALISKSITGARMIAFEDLGPEAVMELTVNNFPAIVAIDCKGNDLLKIGVEKYAQT